MPDRQSDADDRFDHRKFDSVISSPVRLAVLSLLVSAGECEFTFLRDKTAATDGNLNRHLAKLEEAGLIEVSKRFEGKKPVTTQRITAKGREALRSYVKNLEDLLGSASK